MYVLNVAVVKAAICLMTGLNHILMVVQVKIGILISSVSKVTFHSHL